MNRFNSGLADDLEKPIKKGTICAARFKLDDNWYRARVLQSVSKGDYEVQFIDFGNTDTVNGNTGDLKRLPESLLQYEPQAKEASLAYIRVPKIGNTCGKEAAKLVQSMALDTVTEALVVSQSGNHLQVVLFPTKGEKDWNKSANVKLIEKGYAAMQNDDEVPDEVSKWFDVEEEQRDQQTGIWQYGGADALDEEAE